MAMEVVSVTVGLPVRDLEAAAEWYRRVLELPRPELAPSEGVVEFAVGFVWLQLFQGETTRTGAQPVTRFGVHDARRHRDRLQALGVAVGPLRHVPGAVDYFDFADPDGNALSLCAELD